MVYVLRVGLDHGDDGVSRNEAGEVVDVAVGVVAGDAASQPDGVGRAQVVGKSFFVMNARHVGIAFLDFAEETLFGGKDCAGSVDIDRAAFEHDARRASANRSNLLGVGGFRHQGADFFVMPPVGIFRPGVEAELEGKRATLRG